MSTPQTDVADEQIGRLREAHVAVLNGGDANAWAPARRILAHRPRHLEHRSSAANLHAVRTPFAPGRIPDLRPVF
jgi:hypothetical protein